MNSSGKQVEYSPVNRTPFADTHYGLLNLHPSASVIEIRRAYKKLSKLYHPDTTTLPPEEAKEKFQKLNEAYAILANPQTRLQYDLQIGYYRWNVLQTPYDGRLPSPSQVDPNIKYNPRRSSYLEPIERPLSAGELFALLLMGTTIIGCLLLAFSIAWWRSSALS
ncbi:MAG: J domain-containing protein [Geminocystis sp.]|nr:J domain-containing protein [Geminocystis sp.]HIK38313.1 J domain-containing protein [Geminocystis sp. M7585_C2015_104]MCS7148986.1 J domain-containing protein [Geminocystis sp.]MCX8077374.1 J domain-containing protein [Geminocystis sp.]MDW8114803.1 J domain-containing protein [Geminocystis sp.]